MTKFEKEILYYLFMGIVIISLKHDIINPIIICHLFIPYLIIHTYYKDKKTIPDFFFNVYIIRNELSLCFSFHNILIFKYSRNMSSDNRRIYFKKKKIIFQLLNEETTLKLIKTIISRYKNNIN